MKYGELSKKELLSILEIENKKYDEYKNLNLKYDMTRGKPAAKQLELSNDMMSNDYLGDYKASNGFDCRNYGILDGIPEIKKLFGELFGFESDQVIVGGNSSLNLMYDLISAFMLLGASKNSKP